MKVSQMIVEYAGDYIDMGKDFDKKQSYLNVACIAWNISLLSKKEQRIALNKFLRAYEMANPHVNDVSNLEHDMKELIKNKKRLFPKARNNIASAQIIIREDGKDYSIAIASSNQEQMH